MDVFQCFIFPLPAGTLEDITLAVYCGNMMGFFGGKNYETIAVPAKTGPRNSSVSCESTLNLQQVIKIIFMFSTSYSSWGFCPGNRFGLRLSGSTCLFRFSSGCLPCDLCSLMNQKSLVFSFFFQLYLVVRIRKTVSKVFTCGANTASHI